MSEIKNIDARGLSCPQPVLMAENAIKKYKSGIIEVLVSSETAKENVTRMAQHSGWKVTQEKLGSDDIKLTLSK